MTAPAVRGHAGPRWRTFASHGESSCKRRNLIASPPISPYTRSSHPVSRPADGPSDIAAAYSADKIAFDEPFEWQGGLWLTVGTNPAERSAEACRLETPSAFEGEQVGFYHGMRVKRGAGWMVMCGPPARFIAGQKQQIDLFRDG